MIDDQLLADWLTAIPTELNLRFQPGPYRPEFMQGDLLALVTPTPGIGLIEEGQWNVSNFQVELVGRDRNYAKLKASAFQIDEALAFADFPALLWGTWVRSIGRTGSGPVPNQEDEHQRLAYVCTYFAEHSP